MASFVHRAGGENFLKFFKIVAGELEISPVTATRGAKQQVRQRGDLLKAAEGHVYRNIQACINSYNAIKRRSL